MAGFQPWMFCTTVPLLMVVREALHESANVYVLIGAAGVYWLSRITVHGSYLTDLLPGLVIMALGLGAVMVGVQNAANAGVPAHKAGLAAALITTSSTVGAALGLAILTAIATGRTNHLIAAHASTPSALTGGVHAALLACSAFLVVAAVIAARATNTHAGAAATASRGISLACTIRMSWRLAYRTRLARLITAPSDPQAALTLARRERPKKLGPKSTGTMCRTKTVPSVCFTTFAARSRAVSELGSKSTGARIFLNGNAIVIYSSSRP